MKNTILYSTLIAGLVFTTSFQNNAKTKDSSNPFKITQKNIKNPEFVNESIENFAEYDTRNKLYAEFGESNIKDSIIKFENETIRSVSKLTDPRNGNVYNYIWDKNGESLYQIETYYRVFKNKKEKQRQTIDLKGAIYTGMSLNELEEWNGKAFSFSGLSRENGGMVTFKGNTDYDIIVKIGLDKSLKENASQLIQNKRSIRSNSKIANKYPLFVDYIGLKMK